MRTEIGGASKANARQSGGRGAKEVGVGGLAPGFPGPYSSHELKHDISDPLKPYIFDL